MINLRRIDPLPGFLIIKSENKNKFYMSLLTLFVSYVTMLIMENEKLISVNVRQVPEDLKIKFKALCILNNLSMQEGFVKVMEQAVKRGII